MTIRWLWLAVLALGCSSTKVASNPDGGDGGAPPGPTVITTDKGAVQGSQLDTARSFLGIPYAAPPIGDLRWKPPADAAPWSTTRPAQAFGKACPQVDALTGKPSMVGVEDCLFLNVWTPLAVPSKPAPVMVFIHGGGFILGTAGAYSYDGSNLAALGAVVVTLNYRLGPFGFLEHSALAAEMNKPAAPSWGMLDQRAALQWVKRNIAAFGGDPNNVTLFGESAGGVSVCAHLAMPGSKGLFHRAIVESGLCAGSVFTPAATALKQGDDFAQALGCADLACMRSKSASEVAAALPNRPGLFGSPGVVWFPTLDGAEIAKVPTDAFQSGDAPQVPVILGTNKDEFALFTYAWKLVFGHDMTPQEGLDALGFLFTPQQVQSITTQFPPSSFPTTTAWANVVFTDGLFVCPTRKAVRALSAHGNPTYLYQFSYPFNPPVYPNVGAAHSFELPFVFGTNLGGRTIGDEERPTSQAMMGYWTRFAATGDPNGGGAPTWPRYDATSDTHIVLDATIGMGSGLHRDACDFWDKL